MDVKIVINIGDNKIKLTPEEAMELKQALNDMYKEEHIYYPRWPEYYPTWPQYPLQPSYREWYTTSDRAS